MRDLCSIAARKEELRETFHDYDVMFKPAGRRMVLGSMASDKTREEAWLDHPYQLAIVEHTHKPYARQQGLILSPRFIYFGDFEGTAMHGEGTFLFLEDSLAINKTVKGRWEQDSPTQLSIYDAEAPLPLLSIAFMEGEQQAKLTLPDRTTYLGSIRFAHVRSLQEIMTGKGVINFPNRDIYTGEVRNGLMHTETGSVGRFVSRSANISYVGPYLHGFKHGKGDLTFECKGERLRLQSEWRSGAITGSISIDTVSEPELKLPYSPGEQPVASRPKQRFKDN
jgi:hypothetical protein